MANRKPLVIVDGQIQQIQSGDTLEAEVSAQQTISAENGEVGSIVIGTPVYISGAGQVKKAKADASGTKEVIGLVKDASISASETGTILINGVLTATTGQWDTVTGGTGGLTPNAIYFLDPSTAGKLTTTAPSTVGQYVVRIGVAISTTAMKVEPEETVLL